MNSSQYRLLKLIGSSTNSFALAIIYRILESADSAILSYQLKENSRHSNLKVKEKKTTLKDVFASSGNFKMKNHMNFKQISNNNKNLNSFVT